VGEEVEQAVGPTAVLLPDFGTARGGGFNVFEAGAGEVGGDATAGIDVGLAVRHAGDAEEVVELGLAAERAEVVAD
jgi:hypothetical protein